MKKMCQLLLYFKLSCKNVEYFHWIFNSNILTHEIVQLFFKVKCELMKWDKCTNGSGKFWD